MPTQLLLPDYGSRFAQIGETIGGIRRQNALAEAIPGALSGDQNALNRLAQIDPKLGLYAQGQQLEQQRYQRQDARQARSDQLTMDTNKRAIVRQSLTDAAGALVNLPDEQQAVAWPTIRQRLVTQHPELAPELPEQYGPEVKATAMGLAGIKPAAPAGPTNDMREYQQAVAQGFKGTLLDYQTRLKQAGATNIATYGGLTPGVDAQGQPVFVQGSNRGGPAQIVPGVRPPAAGAGKDPTEDQSKAAGWLAQALNAYNNAERTLAESPGADRPNVGAEILGSLPLVGGAARNASLSPAQQKYQQAMSSFAEAALRAATGAGVNREEAAQKIRELTPQIGDSAPLRKQKRDSLMVYLDSFKTRAGRAAPDVVIPNAAAANGGFKYLGSE